MSESVTSLEGIEAKLHTLEADLTRAQKDLAKIRDEEVKAKHAFKKARRRALLREDRPRVARGGFTTAERDAWVEEQIANEELAYDVATSQREAAQDHLRVLRDQAVIVMAIGSSVRAAYSVAGSGR